MDSRSAVPELLTLLSTAIQYSSNLVSEESDKKDGDDWMRASVAATIWLVLDQPFRQLALVPDQRRRGCQVFHVRKNLTNLVQLGHSLKVRL